MGSHAYWGMPTIICTSAFWASLNFLEVFKSNPIETVLQQSIHEVTMVTIWRVSFPGKSATGALDVHVPLLSFEQKMWVQDDPQIIQLSRMGKCNPIQEQRWKILIHKETQIPTPTWSCQDRVLIHLPPDSHSLQIHTASRLWDRTSVASPAWPRIKI